MLNEVWDLISQNSCVIFFISQFSKNQFELRYQGQAKKKTILLPFISDNPVLDNTSDSDNPQKNSYILIVGNHLPHKGLLETASRLANQENISKIIILGLKIDNLSTKIISFESGQLSNTEIFELYSNAQLIIYPSHYEGFGFPIIEALSLNKHIFARNLPAYREIQSNIAIKNNLFLYKHIEDLMEQISSFDNKTSYKYQPLISITWESTTIELIDSIIQHAEDPKNLLNTYYRTKNLYFIEKFWLDSRPINKLPSIEFLLKKIKYIIKNFQRNFLN
jgi:glycosyltransferase involved in cell wall biosynthesis